MFQISLLLFLLLARFCSYDCLFLGTEMLIIILLFSYFLNSYAFRALILPGFGNAMQDYTNFAENLSEEGISSTTVPIQRSEWLNIAKGVISPRFWKDECIPDELFKFYFDKVDISLRKLIEADDEPVVLLCHSAGGWLARGLLGNNNWYGSNIEPSRFIRGIVTLGSPHYPPEVGLDMTKGALKYVNDNFPGSYLKSDIFYLSVAGSVIQGDPDAKRGSIEKTASNSYKMLSGLEEPVINIGDGIVSVDYALLKGSTQLILDGVYHSINAPLDYWYGGKEVIPRWLPTVRRLLQSRSTNSI